MKRKENFVLVFISILLILAVSYFAGCGDDSSYTINAPQGATGSTGNTGITGNTGPQAGTASLVVNVWQDDAHTQPYLNAFTVLLERIYSNPGTSEITTYDTHGEGTVTLADLTPGTYRVYVQSVGYPEQTEDVELPEDTATKATVDLDFVLAPEDRVFYAISNPLYDLTDYTISSIPPKQYYFPATSFHTINATTGAATLISTIDNIVLTGLAFGPDNTLYATGYQGDFYGSGAKRQATNYWGLYKINPFTGAVTPLKALTGDIEGYELYYDIGGILDLSFAPDGKLYSNFIVDINPYKLEASQATANTISEINIDTGEVTALIQPAGYPSFSAYSFSMSIGFSGSNLYFLFGNGYQGDSVYYQWNNYTGATPTLTTLNPDAGYNFFSGMGYYNGNLYSAASTYTNSPVILVSIAPATGIATPVANIRDELDNSLFGIVDMTTP